MPRFDPNGAQAGEYELQDDLWDRPTSKPGDPGHPTYDRIFKGEVVKLDQAEAQRLVRSGSVLPKGEREKREAALAEAQFRMALNNLSPEVRQQVLDGFKKGAAPEGVVQPGEGSEVVQDNPGFQPDESEGPAQRANAQGDGGPDPQTGKEQDPAQVSGAVHPAVEVQEHEGARAQRQARQPRT